MRKKITAANQRIKSIARGVRQTPLELSEYFSELTACEFYMKCEHLQRTGSFKLRGAMNKLSLLTEEQKQRGVITASSGNHGLGVALAARLLGIKANVYVPATASSLKLNTIRRYGASIETVDGDCLEAELKAREKAGLDNKIFVSPYNDEDIICGQGTIGLEIINELPDIDAVFAAVGGGGLISGVGSYLKQLKPQVEIIGCWAENSPAMYEALKVGKIVDVKEKDTLSDGTMGGIEPGTITLPLCQQVIDRKVLVNERQIADTMKLVAVNEQYMIEGAAAMAFAAAIQQASDYKHKKIAVIICGRNITLDKFIGVVGSQL